MAKRLTAAQTAPAPKKAEHNIEREISAAAQRIRWQDGLTGLAGIAVILLAYAATMAILDRWLGLPQWVRQIGFCGFLLSLGTVAYFYIVRPMQKSVNPRFIARQLEGTQAETKNEIINWVDMRERDIPGSIRAAVDAKAAEGLAEADVNTAIRSAKFAWLGGTAMVLVAVLAVLFLVFKASLFTSLLGRAFNPFQTTVIGTRTKIELVEPQPADTTITDGDQLRFVVNISGKKPSAEGPDRVRLLLKQGHDETQYEEIPFTLGSNPREFELAAGRSTIRNGFWYKVAAGDAETPEHRIDVRTRPLVTAFEARYEYPAYTRMVPDIGYEPRIEAHRGTLVTLTVKTNRTLKSGSISFDGKPVPLAGEIPSGARDSLRFKFKLEERTNYRIQFTSADNEQSGPSPSYPIDVLQDRAPSVLIDVPEKEEILLPVNGLLAVDGTIADEFGLESAVLVLRIANDNGTVFEIRKKYLDGVSLKREKDGIHPLSLKYKDSIKLDGLKTDAGVPVTLAPDMVIDYWLEATDNCTEPKANVGKSEVKRVKLVLPPKEPEKKREQDQQNDERQKGEKIQQQGEKEKRDKEKAPKPQQRQDRQPEKKQEPGANDPPEMPDPNMMPKDPPEPGMGEKTDPMNPMKGGEKPNPEELDRKAKEFKEQIDKENQEAGEGKGNSTEKTDPMMPEQNPGENKPKNEKTDPGQASETKEGDPAEGASEKKEPGKVQSPENSKEKPAPSDEKDPKTKPEEKPQGEKEKQEPRGGETAGEEKSSQPKEGSPMDPKGGEPGEGKNAEPKPEDGKPPEKNPTKGAAKAKPDGQPKPSEEKASPKPEENPQGGTGEEKADPKQQPGEGKGQKPTESGTKKAGPKEPPMGSEPGMEKKPPEEGAEKTEPGMEKGSGDPKSEPTGSEKPSDPGELQRLKDKGKTEKRDPRKGDAEQLNKDAEDLSSDNDQKRQDAEQRLDEQIGKEQRDELQKKSKETKKDRESNDPKKQEAAKKDLENAAKNAQANGKGQPKEPTPEELKQLEKDAKDLASKDEKTRKDAEKRLDEKIGKQNREAAQKKAEQIEKDLNSGDPDKKAAAEKELQELAKKAGEQAKEQAAKPKDPTPEEMKQFEKDAKDLASKDEKTRKEAEKRLDEKIGKANREAAQKKAEQIEKDLNSNDADKKAAAEKELQELAKQASELAKKNPPEKPRDPTPEEIEQFKKDAQDLTSKDEKTRKEAEKKLDEQIGKQAREDLQKDLKDLADKDPQKAKEAMERIAQKMKNPGNGGKGQEGQPLEENAENRLKTAERQLEQFKKYRGNKDFLKKSGMTEAEYEKFLQGYEEMVAKQKEQVEAEKLNPPGARPGGPTTVGGNDGSGGRVERNPTTTGVEGPGGAGVAPPGFGDPQGGFTIPRRPKK